MNAAIGTVGAAGTAQNRGLMFDVWFVTVITLAMAAMAVLVIAFFRIR